jgi:hypothetical protein
MVPRGIIYTKLHYGIQNRHIHRQEGDLIRLLSFFKNKENSQYQFFILLPGEYYNGIH